MAQYGKKYTIQEYCGDTMVNQWNQMMILCQFEMNVAKYLDTTKVFYICTIVFLKVPCKLCIFYGTQKRAPVQCESRNVTCCNLLD